MASLCAVLWTDGRLGFDWFFFNPSGNNMRIYECALLHSQPQRHIHTFKCPEVLRPHCWGLARWYHLSGTSIDGTLWVPAGPPTIPMDGLPSRSNPTKNCWIFSQSLPSLPCQHVFLIFRITFKKTWNSALKASSSPPEKSRKVGS